MFRTYIKELFSDCDYIDAEDSTYDDATFTDYSGSVMLTDSRTWPHSIYHIICDRYNLTILWNKNQNTCKILCKIDIDYNIPDYNVNLDTIIDIIDEHYEHEKSNVT